MKRFLFVLLTILLLSALVFAAVATDVPAKTALTITVNTSEGQPLTGALVFVTATDGTHRAVDLGNGTYTFQSATIDTTYNIHVACDGYYASIQTVSADTPSLTVTLEPEAAEDSENWVEFGVFYAVSNKYPSDYCAPGTSQTDYGPSGDGTPLVTVAVDTTRLRTVYASVVTYRENVDRGGNWFTGNVTNLFEISPSGTTDEIRQQFSNALKECMRFESEQAFRATNLYETFLPYALKAEHNSGGLLGKEETIYHLDGVMDVDPPVYVVELHINGTSFGGFVTDEQIQTKFPTMDEVLASYEKLLNQSIEWTDATNGGVPTYNGVFVEGKTQYTVTVTQTEYSTSNTTPDGAYFRYQKVSSTYYLAKFNLTLSDQKQVTFTATYTDGVDYDVIFPDQVRTVNTGDADSLVGDFTGNTYREGYAFLGWSLDGDTETIYSGNQAAAMVVDRDLVFTAVYVPVFTVSFHSNLPTGSSAVFRTYYSCDAPSSYGTYFLEEGNCFGEPFYEIPTFDYATHNQYIFKGWYMGPDSNATPLDWDHSFTEDTDVYAHWIEVGTVAQADTDRKVLPENWNKTYQGYDLVGVQLRKDVLDDIEHYGEAGAGIRFITVLSQAVYDQLTAIAGNENGAEYGLVLAKADNIPSGVQQLQYKGTNVNGTDTSAEFSFVTNLKCSGVVDHYTGKDANGNVTYRLYTGVVTYKKAAAQGEEALQAAYASNMVARAYIRYYDGNGLLRTYYNNYSGTQTLQGCSISYNKALELLQIP